MPFKSAKQRAYLFANEPEIARRWADTYGSKPQPKAKSKSAKKKKLSTKSRSKSAKKLSTKEYSTKSRSTSKGKKKLVKRMKI